MARTQGEAYDFQSEEAGPGTAWEEWLSAGTERMLPPPLDGARHAAGHA